MPVIVGNTNTEGVRTASQVSNSLSHRSELDSRADTCVLGNNSLVIYSFNKSISVSGFDPSVPPKNVPLISGALLYTLQDSGEEIILVINQALHMKNRQHNLLNQMQIRMNDIQVNECPKHLIENPTALDHAIVVKHDGEKMVLPLSLNGTTSFLETRKPTLEEYNSLRRFELTSDTLEWDPISDDFMKEEEKAERLMEAKDSSLEQRRTKAIFEETISEISLSSSHAFPFLQDNSIQLVQQKGTRSEGVSEEDLARYWNIPRRVAEKTLKLTTQRGVRYLNHPCLARRFQSNDRHLRYKRLNVTMFSDTLFSSTASNRNNKCAQVYATNFGWSSIYPMQRKGDTHETLSSLFSNISVPNEMIVDNAKELVQGEFKRKLKQADYKLKRAEDYIPNSNLCEGVIRELKRTFG